MRLKRITAFLLFALAAVLALDLLVASTAEACPAGPDCYPWGAEGPVAGSWSYASKANYLVAGAAKVALIFGAALSLIWQAEPQNRVPLSLKLATLAALAIAGGLLWL